jgi:hypothetical protein
MPDLTLIKRNQKFYDYCNINLPTDLRITNTNCDQLIFGSKINAIFGLYGQMPKDMSYNVYIHHKEIIKLLCEWITINLFNKLLSQTEQTETILLKILESRLKKYDIEYEYIDEIMYNTHTAYHIRKAVITKYYYEVLLELPF